MTLLGMLATVIVVGCLGAGIVSLVIEAWERRQAARRDSQPDGQE